MAILLLIIIYLTFISLGLPDSILGSTFPAISENLSLMKDLGGYIALTVSIGTIISSFFSDFFIKKFGTRWVVTISVLLTSLGLIGFSLTRSSYPYLFFISAIPLGLGAGSIDAALNNYVALNYRSIHMNWLHCFWGVGASLSPLIIASFIDSKNHSKGWNYGILFVAFLQLAIFLILLLALPLWKKASKAEVEKINRKEKKDVPKRRELFHNLIFYLAMVSFFSYCALETTAGNWSASFYSYSLGFSTKEAASFASFLYIGISVGRFVSGIISLEVSPNNLIRIGEFVLFAGVAISLLPFSPYCGVIGMLIVGLGCAPIFPSIIKLTPYRFGKRISQTAMGVEMAIAYLGNIAISPLFGLIARKINDFSWLPYLMLAFVFLMFFCHEAINLRLRKRDAALSEEERKEFSVE